MIRLDHTSIVCLALLLAASTAQAQPAQKPIPTGELTGPFRAVLSPPTGAAQTIDTRLHSPSATELHLDLGSIRVKLTRVGTALALAGEGKGGGMIDVVNGTSGRYVVALTIRDRNTIDGTLTDSNGRVSRVKLARQILLPRSDLAEYDAGPPADLAELFARNPDYAEYRKSYWYNFGPVFYRGRLDGSARLLCIASDPGPTECLPFVRRCLVGDAGQRVQGFLSKLGLTRSYTLVNANTYALRPSQATQGRRLMRLPVQRAWRDELYTSLGGPEVQAIIVFGAVARDAVRTWTNKPTHIPTIYLPHPSSRDPNVLCDTWRAAITQLRELVTPDADGDPNGPNYGTEWREEDYARIPRRNLPKDAPS